jgi:hypothetical protein
MALPSFLLYQELELCGCFRGNQIQNCSDRERRYSFCFEAPEIVSSRSYFRCDLPLYVACFGFGEEDQMKRL